MANRYSSTVTIQRTGVATWVVYQKGVNVGSYATRVLAESAAAGLASTAAQTDRIGNRKTAVGEVQVVTLTSYAGTDSFSLQFKDLETLPFVRGTSGASSDLQTALRTATGDASQTVAGTTDEGPFTVTWVAQTTAQPLLQQGTVSGCTLAVTRTVTGGAGF